MTACFKLLKALQPDIRPGSSPICEQCVYFSGNLDPSHFSSNRSSQPSCGLDFTPGDEMCNEMRTNNCSARKNAG